MKLKLLGLRLKAKHLLISIKEINNIHIGERVRYQGEIYYVNNGTAYPYWDLVPLELDENGKRKSFKAHEKHLKKLWFKSFKYSALFHYKFYMSNWYHIDINSLADGREPASENIMGW